MSVVVGDGLVVEGFPVVSFSELFARHRLTRGKARASAVRDLGLDLAEWGDHVFARSTEAGSASRNDLLDSVEGCGAPSGVPVGCVVCRRIGGEGFEVGGVEPGQFEDRWSV
jgi:hypothetical protein